MEQQNDGRPHEVITYQDEGHDESIVHKEGAWFREARRILLKTTSVREEEVWVHQQAKLWAGDEEGRD
jgi:hypothetical protein